MAKATTTRLLPPISTATLRGPNVTTLTAKGSLTGLFNVGADDPLSFSFDGDAQQGTTKIKDTSGHSVKSQGDFVYIASITSDSDAGGAYKLLTAKADSGTDPDVFTLKLYENGNWEFVLKQELDHHDFTAVDNLEGYLGLDLSGFITATDYDGDSVALGGGSFVIQVIDDVPILSGEAETKLVNEDDISTPWSEGTSPHDDDDADPETMATTPPPKAGPAIPTRRSFPARSDMW